MAHRENRDNSRPADFRLFLVAIAYEVLVIIILALVVWSIWNQPDPIILYVPAYVLLWGSIGGSANVLYKTPSYFREGAGGLADFLGVAVVKPVVGAIFGAVAFFGAQIGLVVVSKSTTVSTNNELLSLIAFLGGFSDKFTLDIIDRLARQRRTGDH